MRVESVGVCLSLLFVLLLLMILMIFLLILVSFDSPPLIFFRCSSSFFSLLTTAMTKCLNLEHVHGFSGQTTRNNVLFARDGTIMYTAAALGVCVDASGTQRFMSSHNDDVLSIALSRGTNDGAVGDVVATGEIGRTPKIIVWRTDTMETLSILTGAHTRGVCQLAFSKNGKTLASIGLDNQHTLVLHDWKSQKLLCRVRTGGDQVFGLCFQDNVTLVSCGHRHLSFWTREESDGGGVSLSSASARFGKTLAGELSVVDVCFAGGGRTIVATNLGHLGVFHLDSNSGTRMLPLGKGSIANAHDGAMNCVETFSNGDGASFLTAGVDGFIKIWKCPMGVSKGRISCVRTFDQQESPVQSLSVNSDNSSMLVGTRGGDILSVDLHSATLAGDLNSATTIVSGHFHGEVWGLATHPTNNAVFATAGDDRTVRLWHVGTKKMLARTEGVPDMVRSLVFEPLQGDFLVGGLGGRLGLRKIGTVGEHEGTIMTFHGDTLEILGSLHVAKEQIGDLAFASDGRTLAVASNDNFIYLVDVQSPVDMSIRHRCDGHSSYVTDVSLSVDGQWMMSNDGAGEMLFWSMKTGKREGDYDLFQDVVFSPNTCPLSWETIGCWPNGGDLTDINSSETSPQCGLGVTADDCGKVKLFNTPCVSWDAPYYEHRGHSSHVTNCMWNCDSTRVVSVGGNDRCAFVWRVVDVVSGTSK